MKVLEIQQKLLEKINNFKNPYFVDGKACLKFNRALFKNLLYSQLDKFDKCEFEGDGHNYDEHSSFRYLEIVLNKAINDCILITESAIQSAIDNLDWSVTVIPKFIINENDHKNRTWSFFIALVNRYIIYHYKTQGYKIECVKTSNGSNMDKYGDYITMKFKISWGYNR
jgi:hypothetical protein